MLDTIVIGTDWDAEVTVQAGGGWTATDLIDALTTASAVSVDLFQSGASVVTGTASVASAPDRTLDIGFADTDTTGLTAGTYELDVRVTLASGKIYPVRMHERLVTVKAVA